MRCYGLLKKGQRSSEITSLTLYIPTNALCFSLFSFPNKHLPKRNSPVLSQVKRLLPSWQAYDVYLKALSWLLAKGTQHLYLSLTDCDSVTVCHINSKDKSFQPQNIFFFIALTKILVRLGRPGFKVLTSNTSGKNFYKCSFQYFIYYPCTCVWKRFQSGIYMDAETYYGITNQHNSFLTISKFILSYFYPQFCRRLITFLIF